MSVAIDTKDARIEFKTSKEIKSLLQSAANALGVDLSSYLISTATQRAKEIILKDKMLTLSTREWEEFQTILESESRPTKALDELMNLKGFDA